MNNQFNKSMAGNQVLQSLGVLNEQQQLNMREQSDFTSAPD